MREMGGYRGYLNLHEPLEMQVTEDEERCEEEITGEYQPLLPFTSSVLDKRAEPVLYSFQTKGISVIISSLLRYRAPMSLCAVMVRSWTGGCVDFSIGEKYQDSEGESE